MFQNGLKPAVPWYWLLGAAGLMWSIVGVMLCSLAWRWLVDLPPAQILLTGGAGILGAGVAYYFLFSKIALRNIERLDGFSGKTCLFAFQAWKSYLLILFMVILGMMIRHSSVPRDYLAPLYTTIGGALLLSSLHYYHHLWRHFTRR